MPFYIRKGINFGPLRVNLSKGGVGLSVGGKGLRAGVNASGKTYTHAGREGVYYRGNSGGFTLPWFVMLILGLGLWYADSQGWFTQLKDRANEAMGAPPAKHRHHHTTTEALER